MRFAIFVDGPNLIGSLNKLNLDIPSYQGLYNHVLKNAVEVWKTSYISGVAPPAQLWRVFWYQVGHMDELRLDDQKLISGLKLHFEESKDLTRQYVPEAGKQNPEKSQSQIKEIAWATCFEEAKAWYERKNGHLENMRRFNFSVRSNTDFIEVVENGHWKVNFLRKQIDEKGIDTSLAVDLATLSDSYDVAILISGDADMIPSVNYAKQQGKHVAVVDFINGYPPEKKGRQSSTRLKSAADFVVPVYEMDMVRQGVAKPRESRYQES